MKNLNDVQLLGMIIDDILMIIVCLGHRIFQSASVGIQRHQANVWESKMIWQNISYLAKHVTSGFSRFQDSRTFRSQDLSTCFSIVVERYPLKRL